MAMDEAGREEEDEEEVAAELEAVKAVYGGDCSVLRSFPPLLHLRLIPRTADLTSQQFVEAIIEIRSSSEYPKEPPQIGLVDSKGLDLKRRKLLLTSVRDKATELSSCPMLVSLCEEAIERLSSMNHPDGDCPLCLFPLVVEDEKSESSPFMKLMSCFHCFHCECIIRWWNWLQVEQRNDASGSSNDSEKGSDESIGNCPVCRVVFHAKDFEHVLKLVSSLPDQSGSDEIEDEDAENLLCSESEKTRRDKFEATLKLQEENSGLIEPKRLISVAPGMYLPSQVSVQPTTETKESDQQKAKEVPLTSESQSSSSSASSLSNRKPGTRKPRPRNPRKHEKHRIRKEDTFT